MIKSLKWKGTIAALLHAVCCALSVGTQLALRVLALLSCSLTAWSSSVQTQSLCWQWLTRARRASLQVPPPWLTVWPSAGSKVKHALHAGHRLLYRCPPKINEGTKEGNKAGFTSGAFVSLSPTCKVFQCTFFYSFLHNLLCYPWMTDDFSCFMTVCSLFCFASFFNCRTIKKCIGNVVYIYLHCMHLSTLIFRASLKCPHNIWN